MASVSDIGSGRPAKPVMRPCNSWSPHEPSRRRLNRGEQSVPVQCNRPSGHSGNHMCLLGSFERLAEWEQAKVVI